MPRINLLPWREQQRAERKKAFGVGMVAAMVGAAGVYGAGLLMMGAMIDSQESRNNQLRSEINARYSMGFALGFSGRLRT